MEQRNRFHGAWVFASAIADRERCGDCFVTHRAHRAGHGATLKTQYSIQINILSVGELEYRPELVMYRSMFSKQNQNKELLPATAGSYRRVLACSGDAPAACRRRRCGLCGCSPCAACRSGRACSTCLLIHESRIGSWPWAGHQTWIDLLRLCFASMVRHRHCHMFRAGVEWAWSSVCWGMGRLSPKGSLTFTFRLSRCSRFPIAPDQVGV